MPQAHTVWPTTRRDFLKRAGLGFGGLALAALMAEEDARGEVPAIDPLRPLALRPTHHPAKAKSGFSLSMEGGPSHIDLFDPKPALEKWHGQPLPPSFGKVFTPMGVGGNTLMASKRKFARHGQSGTWVSDWYPHVSRI